MVTTQNTPIEISSQQQRKKAFHVKYLAICKNKNIQPLAEVKMKQKNIHVVDFHADRVRVCDWLAICNAFENDKTLKFVAIRLRKNDEMVFEDMDTLKKAKSVKNHPVIYAKFILLELLNAIQRLLTNNSQLETLTLEGIPAHGRYMTHLAKGLCSNRSLKVLNFARSNMGDEACEILCSNIKHLTNIETVNFSHCNLGPKGATAIRDFIRFQKIHRFSEAWIRSLRYQNVDASSFDGVKKIMLNNNPQIGDEGLQILIDELREDVWIKEIEMQHCGLSSSGADLIIDCLQVNKTIACFNVNNNPEIPEHLLRHIMINFGSSLSVDNESIESDAKSIQQKITKSQLVENIKFLEDQLESEIFCRKEMEKLNDQLMNQLKEIQNDVTLQRSTFHIPDGYTLVTNEELHKLVVKKSTFVAHRTISNAAVRLRRQRKQKSIKKVQSLVTEPKLREDLSKTMSDQVIKVDVAPKRMINEEQFGNLIDIGGGGDMGDEGTGLDLLRSFSKWNRNVTKPMSDEYDPRELFQRKSKLIVPSNSDADSDE